MVVRVSEDPKSIKCLIAADFEGRFFNCMNLGENCIYD